MCAACQARSGATPARRPHAMLTRAFERAGRHAPRGAALLGLHCSSPLATAPLRPLHPALAAASSSSPSSSSSSSTSSPDAHNQAKPPVARTPLRSVRHSRRPFPTLLLPAGPETETTDPKVSSSSRSLSMDEAVACSSGSFGPSSAGTFEVTFLGTASGRPTPARNVTGLALRVGHSRPPRLLIFDAGDGTQNRVLQARHLSLAQLSLLFVTHMHGDHVFGLMNLIAASCTRPHPQPLHIFGPQGISYFIKHNLSATHTWLERPLIFHELLKNNVAARTLTPQPDVLYHQNPDYSQLNMQIFEDDEIVVHAGSLKHRDLSCWGYVVSEKAAACHPLCQPRKIAILGDTCDSSGLKSVAQDADVMVHEATFLETELPKVYQTGHSTAGMAGAFARSCGVRHLLLTHFSHRYIHSELETGAVDTEVVRPHVEQARQAAGHERVHAAQDLQVFHVAPKAAATHAPQVSDPQRARQQPQAPLPKQAPSTTSTPKAPTPPLRPPAAPPATPRPTLHIAMPTTPLSPKRQLHNGTR